MSAGRGSSCREQAQGEGAAAGSGALPMGTHRQGVVGAPSGSQVCPPRDVFQVMAGPFSWSAGDGPAAQDRLWEDARLLAACCLPLAGLALRAESSLCPAAVT